MGIYDTNQPQPENDNEYDYFKSDFEAMYYDNDASKLDLLDTALKERNRILNQLKKKKSKILVHMDAQLKEQLDILFQSDNVDRLPQQAQQRRKKEAGGHPQRMKVTIMKSLKIIFFQV